MKKTASLTVFAAALLGAFNSSAEAQVPVDLEGTYDLTCSEASITIGVQQLEVKPSSGGATLTTPVNKSVSISVPCAPASIAVFDAFSKCMTATSGLTGISSFRTSLCNTVKAVADKAVQDVKSKLNGDFTVDVRTQWLGSLYNMTGVVKTLDNKSWSANYLINTNGSFATASVIPGVFSAAPLCSATVGLLTQTVTGKIDRTADYDLTGKYASDVSLLCSVPTGTTSQTAAARIGVTFRAEVAGPQL